MVWCLCLAGEAEVAVKRWAFGPDLLPRFAVAGFGAGDEDSGALYWSTARSSKIPATTTMAAVPPPVRGSFVAGALKTSRLLDITKSGRLRRSDGGAPSARAGGSG